MADTSDPPCRRPRSDPSTLTCRVVLVDDHAMMREGLELLLSRLPNVTVVGQAESGQEAVSVIARLQPDVVLMDVAMPGLNGIEATRQVLAANPGVKVIALSAYTDRKFVAEMFRIGASGYVIKGAPFDDIVRGLRAALDGRRFISDAITHQVLDDYSRQLNSPIRSTLDVLSAREREVLQLLAEGLAGQEIARRLCVSVKTIETHRRAIMSKLNVHSVAELTKIAIREGLTSLEF